MKKNNLFITVLVGIFLISIMSSVSAQAFTQTTEEMGIDISYPKFIYYYKGEPYNLTVETYNRSDGQRLINSSCEVEFWNNNGETLLDQNLTGTEDYSYYIPEGSLGIGETKQIITFNLYCENEDIGGFADGTFEVRERNTSTLGFNLNDNINFIFLIILFVIGVVLFFTVNQTLGSSIILISGLILLFNSFQPIISTLISILGIGGLIYDSVGSS